MKQRFIVVLALSFAILACSKTEKPVDEMAHATQAVLWYQQAAEADALFYQAYNLAENRLFKIRSNDSSQNLAIVTDLDETVIDNSPAMALQVIDGKAYPHAWKDWEAKGRAEALPGAVRFFQLADSLGFHIYYISNKRVDFLAPTIANLQKLGLPQADENHVFLKTDNSDKEERRQRIIANNQSIVMLMGDNLGDFSDLFYGIGINERQAQVNAMSEKFGHTFIVFPNPVYGDWEKAVFNFDYNRSIKEKDSLRKAALKAF